MACYKKITGEFVGEINSLTVFRLNICWLCSDIKLHGTDYFSIRNCFQDFWCFQDIFKISEVFLFIEQLRKFPQNRDCLWGSRSVGDLDSSFRYQLKIIESSSTSLGFGFVFDFFLHENTCYIDTLPSLEIFLYFPTPMKKGWTRSDMLCNFFFPFPKQKIWWCSLLVSRVVVDLDSWSLKMECASLINMFCFVLYINWKCMIGFG